MEEDIGESKTEGEEVKTIRRRRKRIYQAILKQMEFYFSDANLFKDRFLSKLIKEDSYVDLSVFLTFNKIRALTDNVEDIANSVSKSELLKLSSDRSKVCRVKPPKQNYNEDECSIYVENLPLDAKHDWLSDIFSVYGKVAYVSIPKYRQSGKIKGFAFVEFDSVEAANQALEAYGAAGCCLPTDMPPENLCSIATFEPGEGKNQVGFVERPVKLEEEQDERKSGDPKENIPELVSTKEEADHDSHVSLPKDKKKKRKREEDDTEEPSEEKDKSSPTVKKKRAKEECASDENEDDSLGASKKKKKKGKSVEEDESSLLEGSTSLEAEEDASPVSKKKMKKRKLGDAEEVSNKADEENEDSNIASSEENCKDKEKRKRKLEESENEEELEDDTKRAKAEEEEEAAVTSDNPEEFKEKKKKRRKRNKEKKEKLTEEAICLQILSKKEWKRLRNKYLMLQRKNMKQLRAQIMGHRWDGPWKKHDRNGSEMHDEDWQGEEEQYKEYSEEHTPVDDEKTEKKPESSVRVQFTPGVILKVQLKEPLESAKKFKAEVKHLPKSNVIAYIDARDANSIVHLRCETAEAAKELLEDLPWEDREILAGEEEKEYWDKILLDRDEKIKKKIRVKKRGRDKILGKAENLMGKHLRYDN